MAYITGTTARINGTTISVSPANPASGNLLVVYTSVFQQTLATATCADNANNSGPNTWTASQNPGNSQQAVGKAFYAANCQNRTSGTYTVTVTGSSAADRGIAYEEIDGIVASGSLNTSNSAIGSGATHATGSITSGVACTLVIAGTHNTTDTATAVAATGFTFPAASTLEDSTNMPAVMGYRTGAAAGTYSPTPTWENGQYAWAILAFEESAPIDPGPANDTIYLTEPLYRR
jgi:hypothetical protein